MRVEKGEQFYFLMMESEGPREDQEVLAEGAKALAQMVAIMLAGDPNFRPPTVHGITKKLADGSLFQPVNLGTVNMQARFGVSAELTVLGPDGKIIENKGPTENQVLRLSRIAIDDQLGTKKPESRQSTLLMDKHRQMAIKVVHLSIPLLKGDLRIDVRDSCRKDR